MSSFPYTAQQDGFVRTTASATQWMDTNLSIEDRTLFSYKNPTTITGFNICFSQFIKKGQILKGSSMTAAYFYPAQKMPATIQCIKY